MNYLDLINKCLVELNYKQVHGFGELTKNEHKKIRNIINVLNAEICGFDKWNFLLREKEINLPANTSEIENVIDGRIASLLIGNAVYDYCEDFEKFYLNAQRSNTYSVFNNKILLPEFNEDKTIKILYYTNNHAISEEKEEKFNMEEGSDCSLIPEQFAEPLLVYGTCMRLKGNPQHIRFNYWYGMYKDALANMRSKISVCADETPTLKMHRS